MTIPQGWQRVPISTLYLGLYDGPHGTPPVASEGPIFLGIGNITEDGHLDLSTTKHIAPEDFPKWTKRIVPRKGDIVFSYEATLNRYAIIHDGFHGCLGRRLALIRPDPNKVDTRFLHYYFFSADWRTTVERNRLAGATVDRIPLSKFPTFPVNIPEIGVQRRVAGILSTYDDLIEVNQRRIAILEDMARRLFDEWFVRFRYPGHESVPLVETELGMVPAGWKLGTVQDVVVLQRGFDLPNTQRSVGPYPVIAATGEHGLHSEFKVRGPGIVTGRSGSLGKVMHISGDFWPLNTTLWGKDYPLGSTYFAYFTVSNLPFGTLNAGAAVPSLNRNHVHLLPQVVPPHDVVALFDKVVAPMFALKRSLLVANARLREARDLLLPKLISGEIDVSAAEETFAEAAE